MRDVHYFVRLHYYFDNCIPMFSNSHMTQQSETIRPWKRMSDKIVWLLNHVFSSKNSHYHNWQCLWPFIRKNVLTFALYQFHFTSKVRFRNKSMTHILRKIRPWSKVLLKAISIYYADTFVSWTQIMRLLWYP